jgi:hypothetical protein
MEGEKEKDNEIKETAEKKIIKVLMDDDNRIEKKIAEKKEIEEKETTEGEKEAKSEDYLSEIEKSVLRVIIIGASNLNDIIRITHYPEVIVGGAVRRLISKGYIDENFNPTEKARFVSFKSQVSMKGYRRGHKFAVIDIAIIIALLLFLISVFYYTGLIG